MHPRRPLAFRHIAVIAGLFLAGVVALRFFTARDRLWCRSTYHHLCHSCGVKKVTRAWAVLDFQGFSESFLERTTVSAVLLPDKAEVCSHQFILANSLEERLSIVPSLIMHESFRVNGALDEIRKNASFVEAMTELSKTGRVARTVWENICLHASRAQHPDVAELSRLLSAHAPSHEIAEYLAKSLVFNSRAD